MTSTRELKNPRQSSIDKVVRDGGDRHSHGSRDGFLRHDDPRGDNAFSVSRRVSVIRAENEMHDRSVDFDANQSGNEGVLNRDGFAQRDSLRRLAAGHAFLPLTVIRRGGASRNLCDNYKPASLYFSNVIQTRSRLSPSPCATIAGDIAPHGVTGAYLTTPPQPFTMSGQLASGDFIVVARLVFQRAYSLRSNKVENSTTDTAKALPGIVDGSVYRFGPHGQHQTMRRFENVQKVSEGSYV